MPREKHEKDEPRAGQPASDPRPDTEAADAQDEPEQPPPAVEPGPIGVQPHPKGTGG